MPQRPRQVEPKLRALTAIVRPVDGRLEAGRGLREPGESLRARLGELQADFDAAFPEPKPVADV